MSGEAPPVGVSRRLILCGRPRGSGADRVADRDLVAAHLVELARDAHDGLGIDLAFVRAAEADRNIAAHFQSARDRFGGDFGEAGEAFFDRAVRVALREAFAGGAEDDDFIGPADRSVQPLRRTSTDAPGLVLIAATPRVVRISQIGRTNAALDDGAGIGEAIDHSISPIGNGVLRSAKRRGDDFDDLDLRGRVTRSC